MVTVTLRAPFDLDLRKPEPNDRKRSEQAKREAINRKQRRTIETVIYRQLVKGA